VTRPHPHSFPTRRSSDLAPLAQSPYQDILVSGLDASGHNDRAINKKAVTVVRATQAGQIAPADATGYVCEKLPAIGSIQRMEHRSEEHTSELQSRENLVC